MGWFFSKTGFILNSKLALLKLSFKVSQILTEFLSQKKEIVTFHIKFEDSLHMYDTVTNLFV